MPIIPLRLICCECHYFEKHENDSRIGYCRYHPAHRKNIKISKLRISCNKAVKYEEP